MTSFRIKNSFALVMLGVYEASSSYLEELGTTSPAYHFESENIEVVYPRNKNIVNSIPKCLSSHFQGEEAERVSYLSIKKAIRPRGKRSS